VPVAARAGNAEEQRARPHGLGVVREVRQLDRRATDHGLRCERLDHALELHPAGCYPWVIHIRDGSRLDPSHLRE
jgi:hypothetical protein